MGRGRVDGYRISPQQERVWWLSQSQDGPGYSARCALLVQGNVDDKALKAALADVVRRHEILRTGFRRLPGMVNPVQVITDSGPSWNGEQDWNELDEREQRASIEALLQGASNVSFDLEAGRVCHVSTARLAPERRVLLLSLPALCGDSTTFTSLVRELSLSYRARLHDVGLPDEPTQYADVAEWQNELLESEDTRAGREYWAGQQSFDVHSARLPLEVSNREPSIFEPRVVLSIVPPRGVERIEKLARERGATPSAVLLACWQILLSRLTGQREVVVALACDGRMYEGLSSVLGPLTKYLPLRCRVEEERSFGEMVSRTHEGMHDVQLRHEYFTWERMNGEGEASHPPPFFPFGFRSQTLPEKHSVDGVCFSIVAQQVRTERFKVELSCSYDEGSIAAALHYDARLFAEKTIVRLGERFQQLLESAIERPDREIHAFEILTEQDRRELLVAPNETDVFYPPDRFLHQLFDEQAARAPDRIAVELEGRCLTYGELGRSANRLARYLQARGVGPEVRTALCLERSLEMVVALLGVLKAGGAYVPLDPAYPRGRLEYMLRDARAEVVLTDERLAARIDGRDAQVIRLDRDWARIAEESGATPASEVTAANLAYVMYTSGSTGRPKGVMIQHGGLSNYLRWCTSAYRVEEGSGAPVHSSLGFDLTVTSLLSPLLAGRVVVLLPHEREMEELEQAFRSGVGFSLVKLTPTHLEALNQLLPPDAADRSTRALIIGGEALTRASLAFWRSHAPEVRLINEYGPTETVVGCCVYEAPSGEELEAFVPIGRPIANTRVYVLDGSMRAVPAGLSGELYIGGAGLARGYLNRPELTAEKFVPDPFGSWPGLSLYRSGDVAEWMPNGNLRFWGRRDAQVKIRGFRVELGEIENLLREHPEVRQAAVLAREDVPGKQRLVAYLALSGEAKPSVDELRSFLRRELPEHMVPAAFVMLKSLPLTTHGKLDRGSLPEPERVRPEMEARFVPPRTPAERQLAEIWSAILGVDRIGIHDSFFDRGGDSIQSILVVARAKQAGLRLNPQQLFQYPTIAELARVAEPCLAMASDQGPVVGPVPLTPIQRWFFERRLPEPHHFNQSVLLEVRQSLDARALRAAVRELMKHHDALRLCFQETESGWEQDQSGLEAADLQAFSIVDLRGLSGAEQKDALETCAAGVQSSLDLASGPLLRVVLFQWEGASGRLLMVAHHLVVDGVSWRILLEDLWSGYEQLSQLRSRGSVQLPPKTSSFQAWSRRLSEYARSERLEVEKSFWRGLSSGESAPMPVDFAPSTEGRNDEASVDTVVSTLSAEETRSLLQEVPSAYRTQIQDVLLTAFARAYRSWTGERSLVLDLEGHGREELFADLDVTRTVGWFTALFPVRLDLPEADDPARSLKAIKEQLRRIPERGIGYGVLRYLRYDEGLAEVPGAFTPQVSFNYLGQFDRVLPEGLPLGLASESSGPAQSPRGQRSHLLDVTGGIAAGRLEMVWTYSRAAHKRSTIEHLAEAFLSSLRELVAHCRSAEAGGATPSDFPLARLSQPALSALLGTARWVEDVYPATPLQSGMLFHSLYAPESAVYFEQVHCTIAAPFEVDAFRRAWQHVVDRHSVLRTGFVWEGLEKPLQLVHRRVASTWDELDWIGSPAEEQERRLERFLQEDRKKGFDLTRPPLMRSALIRVDDSSWRFVWSYHHLVLDGWSVPMLLKEVMLAYQALAQGREASLDAPPAFREYVAWLEAQDLSAAEAFWREELKGFVAPTRLLAPASSNPSIPETESQGEEWHQLTPELTSSLSTLSSRHQLTLATLVQGAWALLTSRYSGDEDVLFGTTFSGRSAPLDGIESMLGLLINTLPVRVGIRGDERLLPWLQELQNRQAELRRYEFSPLVEIQRWSDVPAGQPLFETLLVFENYPVDRALTEEGVSPHVKDVRYFEKTNYPLALVAAPGRELSFRMLYDLRRFETSSMRRILRHLERLLSEFASDPERRLSALSMLSAAEREQVLSDWNRTATDYPAGSSLQTLFEIQVEAAPEAIAVVAGDSHLSRGELSSRANRIAHALRRRGVGPEVCAGILMERSPEWVTGIVGIVKAGGVYVPLPSDSPPERLTHIIDDAGISVVLAQERMLPRLPPSDVHVIALDGPWESEGVEGGESAPCQTSGDSLAYVIYTSGSTGIPKGVAVPHRAVSRLVLNTDYVPLDGSDVVAHASNESFDAATFEIWGPLLSGGLLVVVPKETALAPRGFADFLREERITTMFVTTALFNHLVREAPDIFRPLRHLLFGGEGVSPHWVRELMQGGPPERLLHVYGPTENTTFTTWECVTAVAEDAVSVPIGRAIANSEVYLVDSDLNPVPVGVAGELATGGDGLARSYLKTPGQTAERFVPHPFGHEPGARLYRCGDLCRWLPEGRLEFLGRADHQVKLRGFRIELSEVESVARRHGQVKDAVVLAREDHPGDKRLVAYVVPDRETSFDVADLRRHLKSHLPEYMIPSSIVILDSLPLTKNGKVDRRALPAPAAPDAARAEGGDYVAPRTPVEEKLGRIWSEVLDVERVGIHDDFFELGGHSLLATRIVSRVTQAFEVELSLRELFEKPTVAALAETIESIGRGPKAMPLEPIAREAGNLPVSFAQQRLWVLDQLVPGNPSYNIPVAVRLEGSLDAGALHRTMQAVVRRHETLRTTFSTVDGTPVQVIAPELDLAVPVVDLSGLPVPERDTEAQRLLQAEAWRSFDLSAGPLLRVCRLRLGRDENTVMLTMHHIVSDGWSMGVLVRELATLYRAFSAGEPSPLEELKVQYVDFAHWQRERLAGDVLEEQLGYWLSKLADLPVLRLGSDRPRPEAPSFRGASERFELPKTTSDELKALTQREGGTPFMTLMAAFQTLMSCYTGQTDIVVGTDVANRNRAETEGLIGFFVNQLVMRADLAGDPTFREILARVRKTTLESYAHQDLPFDRLVEALNPERAMNRTPLFQVKMVLQNNPLAELKLAGLSWSPVEIENPTAKFDLLFSLWESDDGLRGVVEYSTDLFDRSRVVRMLEDFQVLLRKVISEPEASLQTLSETLAKDTRDRRVSRQRDRRSAHLRKLDRARRTAVDLPRAGGETA
jgi:amino acid adenylation domain-containing protein/non-ribosomal peptide synthase protein (TIGR01720 family)